MNDMHVSHQGCSKSAPDGSVFDSSWTGMLYAHHQECIISKSIQKLCLCLAQCGSVECFGEELYHQPELLLEHGIEPAPGLGLRKEYHFSL